MAFSKDWKIIYCNDAYANLINKETFELVGKKLADVLPQLVGTPIYQAYVDVLETGEMRLVEGEINGISVRERIYKTPTGIITLIQDLTERKRTKRLTITPADWRDILDEIHDGVLIFDAYNGRIHDANYKVCELFGYSRDEILKIQIGDLFNTDMTYSRENFLTWVKKVYNEYKTQQIEWVAINKSGHQIWTDIKAKTVTIGENTYVLATIQDITSFKVTQHKLRESVERLHELIENTEDMMYVHDLNGNYTRVNSAAERITGYWREELLKMNVNELVADESRKAVNEYLAFARNMAQKRKGRHHPMTYEGAIITKDGRKLYLDISSWLLYSRGEAIGVQGIARDITARKLEEASLIESEERLEDIIDCLPDPTLAIDLEGRVILWNSAMERFTGINAHDMLGKGNYEYAIPLYGERRPILVDLLLNPDQVSRDYEIIERDNFVVIGQTRTPKPGSGGRQLWGTASLLYNRRGEVFGAIESIRDVNDYLKQIRE